MFRNLLACYRVIIYAAIAVVIFQTGASAETPVGSNVDNRVLVGVKAPAEGVQKFLPDGWTSTPLPGGPLEGANVLFVFIDSLEQRDAEGKSLPSANRRALALAALGKQDEAVRLFVLRIYTTTPEADPYGVNVVADIARRTVVEGPANGGRDRADTWDIQVADGGNLAFDLAYKTGSRTWSSGEGFPYSAANPEFSRIYRFQQLTDLVASTPMGKSPSGTFSLSNSVPELASIFDGSEEIVAVIDTPIYVREMSLP